MCLYKHSNLQILCYGSIMKKKNVNKYEEKQIKFNIKYNF